MLSISTPLSSDGSQIEVELHWTGIRESRFAACDACVWSKWLAVLKQSVSTSRLVFLGCDFTDFGAVVCRLTGIPR